MEAIKLCRLDTPIIFIEARINLSRFVVTGCAAKTSATVTFPSLNLIRSEERRVGKECRPPGSTNQKKKNEDISNGNDGRTLGQNRTVLLLAVRNNVTYG